MIAWVLRFGLFGVGNPGSGVWLLVLSMLVYGVAFDFFSVSVRCLSTRRHRTYTLQCPGHVYADD